MSEYWHRGWSDVLVPSPQRFSTCVSACRALFLMLHQIANAYKTGDETLKIRLTVTRAIENPHPKRSIATADVNLAKAKSASMRKETTIVKSPLCMDADEP